MLANHTFACTGTVSSQPGQQQSLFEGQPVPGQPHFHVHVRSIATLFSSTLTNAPACAHRHQPLTAWAAAVPL
eukprot:1157584-Pelagomonas_calceolata.AAC.4